MVKTIQGDTFDLIAKRVYGDERFALALIEANPEHRKTVRFPANVELVTPAIETVAAPSDLPPWKRGV